MGVHKKNREMEDLKSNYVKKSSAIFLAVVALLVGAFIGNSVTSLYMGQQQARTGASVPQQQDSDESHQANPVALANLEKATADDPTNAAKWIELGNFCFDHNLAAQAITAYERALELAPMEVNVWSDLGVMFRRTKQYQKAVEAFGNAAALDSKHLTSRFNMGIVYMYDLNDKASAIKMWKEILSIDPNAKTPSGESLAVMIRDLEK